MASSVDKAQFEQFVWTVRRRLLRKAYGLCGDWHEAEDLVQITLWKVYTKWLTLQRRSELDAYTHRALLWIFLTERRHFRWKREVFASSVDSEAVAPDSYGAVADRAVLVPALQQLGARQRAIVTMRFLGDLSVDQTAQALGCTPGTVTSQTLRALRTLRRALEREGR